MWRGWILIHRAHCWCHTFKMQSKRQITREGIEFQFNILKYLFWKTLSDVICQTATHPNECPIGQNHLVEMMTSVWVHYLLLGHDRQAVKCKIFKDFAGNWHSCLTQSGFSAGREHQITFKLDSFRFRCKYRAFLAQNNVCFGWG